MTQVAPQGDLQPAMSDSKNVMVLIQHPHGDIKTPLDEWIRVGPGSRQYLRPVKAYDSESGAPLPMRVVPFRYRNTALSRMAVRLGIVRAPWSNTDSATNNGPDTES